MNIIAARSQPAEVGHIIDLDAGPLIPYDDWKVEKHQKGGQFKWDASKVALYLSKPQQDGKVIEGNKLREDLRGKNPFNANLLDYFDFYVATNGRNDWLDLE
jgi:hypothetical protein